MLNENIRVKEIDCDWRREPKTDLFCHHCQKDIKSNPHYAHVIQGGATILHPDDEHLYESNAGDMGSLPFGSGCARKIGIKWFRK